MKTTFDINPNDRHLSNEALRSELHTRKSRWVHSDIPAWEDHRRIAEIELILLERGVAEREPWVETPRRPNREWTVKKSESGNWMSEYKQLRNETRGEVRGKMRRLFGDA